MPDVTCVGVLVADVIVRPVDTWPDPGRLVVVEGLEVHSGGLAHTTGVILAKLGVPTAVVGRVGADLFGTYLMDVLRAHRVEVHVGRDETISTSTTVVMVASSGERSFLHLPGANTHLRREDVPPALLAQARAAGCRTSLDMAWDARGRWMALLAPCLPHLDLLFGNRDELTRVTGAEDPPRMAAHLRELGVSTVAVKLGEDGAYVDGGTWRGRVPAFSVEVVDTTGAGDAFCGGFLTGYLAGWDLERTTRFANAVGAMCVTAMGGSTGISGMDETLHFMDTASLRT